jgi:hypothetical protein
MAKSGRRGVPPDLKGTLGTLLRTTINQVGAFTDVARRSALTQKQRLDGALLERRRREALADLGEVLYQLLKSGEIELDELPELVQAADEIEELERRIAEAEAESARPRRPVRLTRTERSSPAERAAADAQRERDARPTERVWRPTGDAGRAAPVVPQPVREPPAARAPRGGITFVDDDAPDAEDLGEYMNEADVDAARKPPAD